MREPTHGDIVVGVDGSSDSSRAVAYAVEEALRSGRDLRLVHAIHDSVPMSPMLPMISSETLAEAGARVMSRAADEADRLSRGKLRIDSVVVPGNRAKVLVESSEGAHLVVLGHRSLGMPQRILSHSTTMSVAARADCAVICVPAAWSPGVAHHSVLVGIDGSESSAETLATAFAAADERKASLRVLHAWRMPDGYEAMVDVGGLSQQWQTGAGEALAQLVEQWRRHYPDVAVDIDVRNDDPARALVDASASADLVVIGRRGQGRVLGMPLGSVARALVLGTQAPLEVAPHQTSSQQVPPVTPRATHR